MESKYHFKEIICPGCKHRFVWMANSRSSCILYRRKSHDEQLESAVCPKCNTEMVVLIDSFYGMFLDEDTIQD